MPESVRGVALASAVVEQVRVRRSVVDEGGADDRGHGLSAGLGDGLAVAPQLVVDADGVLGGAADSWHIPSVVGDWAANGHARGFTHSTSVRCDCAVTPHCEGMKGGAVHAPRRPHTPGRGGA